MSSVRRGPSAHTGAARARGRGRARGRAPRRAAPARRPSTRPTRRRAALRSAPSKTLRRVDASFHATSAPCVFHRPVSVPRRGLGPSLGSPQRNPCRAAGPRVTFDGERGQPGVRSMAAECTRGSERATPPATLGGYPRTSLLHGADRGPSRSLHDGPRSYSIEPPSASTRPTGPPLTELRILVS